MRLGCRRVASPFCLPAPPSFCLGKCSFAQKSVAKNRFFLRKNDFLGGGEGKREKEREESERGKKKEGREGERERGGSASAFWKGKNAQGERASSILQELGRIALEKAPGADPRRRREPQISVWKWPVKLVALGLSYQVRVPVASHAIGTHPAPNIAPRRRIKSSHKNARERGRRVRKGERSAETRVAPEQARTSSHGASFAWPRRPLRLI